MAFIQWPGEKLLQGLLEGMIQEIKKAGVARFAIRHKVRAKEQKRQ